MLTTMRLDHFPILVDPGTAVQVGQRLREIGGLDFPGARLRGAGGAGGAARHWRRLASRPKGNPLWISGNHHDSSYG